MPLGDHVRVLKTLQVWFLRSLTSSSYPWFSDSYLLAYSLSLHLHLFLCISRLAGFPCRFFNAVSVALF